jgi:hypothetical protein
MNATLLTGKCTCIYYICCECKIFYESWLVCSKYEELMVVFHCEHWKPFSFHQSYSCQLFSLYTSVHYSGKYVKIKFHVFLHWTHLLLHLLWIWPEIYDQNRRLVKQISVNFSSENHVLILISFQQNIPVFIIADRKNVHFRMFFKI